MLNYLHSTNCFDELFFAFDFNVVNTTERILNALNITTALTSSAVLLTLAINRNLYYNPTDVNYRRKTLGPNVQNQHNVLPQITTLRTGTRYNFRASKQLFHAIFISCIFMSCIWTPCDCDGSSYNTIQYNIRLLWVNRTQLNTRDV